MTRSKPEYECDKRLTRFRRKFGYDNRFEIDFNPVVTILSAGLLWGLVIYSIIHPDKVCFSMVSVSFGARSKHV